MSLYSTTTRVNLRSSPQIKPESLMITLAQNTTVVKIEDSQLPEWWKVKVPSKGVEGFIAARYLEPKVDETPEFILEAARMPEVNLIPKASTISHRNTTLGRAFPLVEQGVPKRNINDNSSKIKSIHNIISWLNVEGSLRYGPTDSQTYCNIYAYDYCGCNGVYIPRVWWTRSAISKIAQGSQVPVIYGSTVVELNANSLYDWFEEFSMQFGWRRVFNLNELQSQVTENGCIGVILGQRLNLNSSGHITCVVPESSSLKAERNSSGNVIRPLQSQAGRYNHKYYVGNWWSDPNKFRAFGYWICD